MTFIPFHLPHVINIRVYHKFDSTKRNLTQKYSVWVLLLQWYLLSHYQKTPYDLEPSRRKHWRFSCVKSALAKIFIIMGWSVFTFSSAWSQDFESVKIKKCFSCRASSRAKQDVEKVRRLRGSGAYAPHGTSFKDLCFTCSFGVTLTLSPPAVLLMFTRVRYRFNFIDSDS